MRFHVGQRVKRVRHYSNNPPLGTEGIVFAPSSGGWVGVWWDNEKFNSNGGGQRHSGMWWHDTLAPALEDPLAAQFIERVKSWKPEPVVPLPVKETTRFAYVGPTPMYLMTTEGVWRNEGCGWVRHL